MIMTTKTSRRRFLQSAGGALFVFPALWIAKRTAGASGVPVGISKSRMVAARKDGLLRPPSGIDVEGLGKLLDEAMRALSDKKDPIDAWRALFSSSDQVAIKVNALGGRMLSPHPELAYLIAERLVQAGVSPGRVAIWDRSERELVKAGYDPAAAAGKAVLIATDSKGVGYEEEPEISGSIGSCFSRVVSRGCTALINLGVLKDHDLSGVSVAMKNLFGVIHNPNKYHFDVHKDPYLPDLCLHPYIRTKLRLNICDGFRAQCDGGPSYSPKGAWEYGGLLISTDPVALDSVGARIIEQKRRERKLPSLKDKGKEPLYIQLAEEKKAGIADLSRIEFKEVTV
ncbi:MAG: DUF362 domain-containing protein [bacterium]